MSRDRILGRRVTTNIRRLDWRAVCFSALIAAGLASLCAIAADRLFPFPDERLHRPAAVTLLDRKGTILRIILPADEKYRFPVRLEEVSPDLIRALLASEDRSYFQHPGIDPLAVVRAGWTNLRAGRIVSGASTIPMQIARMASPRRRSFTAKALEAMRALQLTCHHSKRELLEIYLNTVPYGSNIEGIGAASYFYFGKSASRLSLGEIALLTTLPRSPNGYDPLRNRETARRARNLVLAQLLQRGAFSRARIEEARRQQLPSRRTPVPFEAPHFCDLAMREGGGAARITTTLDAPLQQAAEQRLAARVAGLRERGIENAAAVVIDIRTREVRAMVGSAAFFDPAHDGQVNGALARRSPGSALKPFLYARALDDGRIVPDSYLLDIPTDYSGYVAENYDGTYRGRVTAREALVQSLNAPAVRLLNDVGVDSFLTTLRRGGLRSLDRPGSDYGLPLILGSGEVRLIDLTNLYATLADGGMHRPWRTVAGDGVQRGGERLFSHEASALIGDILVELRRPDLPQGWELTTSVPRVAWKTGTSYGHRDAWSVGFSGHYAVGVWVGNFDGHGVKGLSGSEHAAPLLFDLFQLLADSGVSSRLAQLPDIESIEVCEGSHQLPTPWCPRRIKIRRIRARTRLGNCPMHRQILVDRRSGFRLSGDCVSSHGAAFRTIATDSAELVSYRRATGEQVTELPPLSRDCREIEQDEGPRIVAPDPATPYRIRPEAPIEFQQIRLSAHASQEVAMLYWYEDGALVASQSSGHAAFLEPRTGRHRLSVVDDLGRSDNIVFEVEGGRGDAAAQFSSARVASGTRLH